MWNNARTAHVFIVEVKAILTCFVSINHQVARLRLEFVDVGRLQFRLTGNTRHEQLSLLVVECFWRHKHFIWLWYYYLLGVAFFCTCALCMHVPLHWPGLSSDSFLPVYSTWLNCLMGAVALWCLRRGLSDCNRSWVRLHKLDVLRTQWVQWLLELVLRELRRSLYLARWLRNDGPYKRVHLRLLVDSTRVKIALWRVWSEFNQASVAMVRTPTWSILRWISWNLLVPTLNWLRSLVNDLLRLFGLQLYWLSYGGMLRVLVLMMISQHRVHVLLICINNW